MVPRSWLPQSAGLQPGEAARPPSPPVPRSASGQPRAHDNLMKGVACNGFFNTFMMVLDAWTCLTLRSYFFVTCALKYMVRMRHASSISLASLGQAKSAGYNVQVGDSLEEFLLAATPDPKLRQVMMSLSEAIRTIAFKVCSGTNAWHHVLDHQSSSLIIMKPHEVAHVVRIWLCMCSWHARCLTQHQQRRW